MHTANARRVRRSDLKVDSVVVGAGVVGLAIARALAVAGHEVVVLEAESSFGRHASSRNSEVVHAGIYYPPESLKAKLCVEGKRLLYDYCAQQAIPIRQLGKLIVATQPAQRPQLARLLHNAQRCGMPHVQLLDEVALRAREPALRGCAGLWSPTTGIVDSHRLMAALLADAERAGAQVAWNTSMQAAQAIPEGLQVETADTRVDCRHLVLSAGVHSQTLAGATKGLAAHTIPERFLAKGSYFSLRGSSPFSHLIYPVPNPWNLGVHLTLDLAGAARFGPDQQWVEHLDYTVDPQRADSFYAAIRSYWPELPDNSLQPAYSGVRSKTQSPRDTQPQDFGISDVREHGVPGLVALYGIESPGLTACLALANTVVRRLELRP